MHSNVMDTTSREFEALVNIYQMVKDPRTRYKLAYRILRITNRALPGKLAQDYSRALNNASFSLMVRRHISEDRRRVYWRAMAKPTLYPYPGLNEARQEIVNWYRGASDYHKVIFARRPR